MKHVMSCLLMVFTIVVAGCSTPRHHLGTENTPVKQLATIGVMDNEVRILEIDDKTYVAPRGEDTYIEPGKHKFKVKLIWTDLIPVGSGMSFSMTTKSPYIRIGCLTLEAGQNYVLAASDSSDDWVLSFWKGFSLEKIPVPSCK